MISVNDSSVNSPGSSPGLRDSMLCSWARHLTLTVPLSTQVYERVSAGLMLGVNPVMDQHPIQGEVEIYRLYFYLYRYLLGVEKISSHTL